MPRLSTNDRASFQPDPAVSALLSSECRLRRIHYTRLCSSENVVFNFTHFEDNYDLENLAALATTHSGANYPPIIAETETVNATYDIAASFCSPRKPATAGAGMSVILATHGIGLRREHWNSGFKPDEYNFVQWAVARGYPVFFYDRLGCGLSEKFSGYENQLNLQSQVLWQLALKVGAGSYTGSIGKPSKLALMGFSFGSYITHATIAKYPEIADAVVLTAIGLNTTLGVNGNGLLRSFVPRIANLQNAQRSGALDNGHVDKYAQVLNYFKQGFYDTETTDYAEKYKQAFGIAEFLTFPTGEIDAGNFTGAAPAITAQGDYIVCDGWCPGVFDEPAKTYFRNAKFTPYLHPSSSHNLNFHHNVTGAYEVITDFSKENEL